MKLLLAYSELLNNEEYVDEEPPSLFEFIVERLSRQGEQDHPLPD
jgi:hypothetical protein